MKENINMKKIKVSDHAIKRAKERFAASNQTAKGMCLSILGNATYLGETICEQGNRGYLFASGKKAVIVSLDFTTIITIMKAERNYIPKEICNPLQNKLLKLYDTEIRKYERSERCHSKKLDGIKINLNVEIAELSLRIHKTKSESVKMVCNTRIKAITEYIGEFEEKLRNVQREKKHIIYARAALG